MSDEAAPSPHHRDVSADGRFPTASRTATQVALMLRDNNTSAADRLVAELFRRVTAGAGDIPPHALDEPESTGDIRYDTLLAAGLAYALTMRGIAPREWMEAVPALPQEWLWDGDEDSSPEYREYIRRQTPAMLLAKGLLLRDRDFGQPPTPSSHGGRRPLMTREERLRATAEALHSGVLDGLKPSPAAIQDAWDYIEGRRTLEELIEDVRRRHTRNPEEKP
jgi:hypothetical protein